MIAIVTALKPEADPIIEHFGLRSVTGSRGHRQYERGDIVLAVSGIGREAAARAVDRLSSHPDARRGTAWLNIGLAGHRWHELGAAFRAYRVEDDQTGRVWLLSPLEIAEMPPTATVRTVERAESEYRRDVLYDMEASGFVAAVEGASAKAPVEILKIVSDNRQRPIRALSASEARRLVASALASIVRLVESVRQASWLEDRDASAGERW